MTGYYFENSFVRLHYYKFGSGTRHILCFHGLGMHGRQFALLEPYLGGNYTLWGFDLFFHEKTILKDTSSENIRKGLQKTELTALISAFCAEEGIDRFSVIAYSMGTHYATTLAEQMAHRMDAYIMAAPSSIEPGRLIRFLSTNKIGNSLLHKMMYSKTAMWRTLDICRTLGLIDDAGRSILRKEIETPELRMAIYASFTYLSFLETDEQQLIKALRTNGVKSIFVFGRNDKMYPSAIGKKFFIRFREAEVLVLESNHELINRNFAENISRILQ